MPLLFRWLACAAFCATFLSAQAPAGFEVGFEERIRSEDWDNLIDHQDPKPDYRTQYRFRTRFWARYHNGSDLEIVAGLLNENRTIPRPGTAAFNGREVFFETLYADYAFTPALSLRVGRQNLVRGEGFVLFDGTTGDGSRSQYFNAADIAYAWGQSRLEFLAISNPLNDRYLPVLNKIENPAEMNRLTEWDEQALGVYFTTKAWAGAQLDSYYLYKTERNFDRTNRAIYQPDRYFSTLGGRLAKDFRGGWTATGEFAYQWGRQVASPGAPASDIRAWGGYARLKKTFVAPWKPSASVGYVGLSGQDPHRTGTITAWNPVFGRWPKWSELYIYSQAPEKGVAYWTNTGMWELEFRCAPTPSLGLRATYCRLAALEPLAAQAGPVFGTGRQRGDLWEVRADYTFSSRFKVHGVYEHLEPGNAYSGRDGGRYLRFEMTYLLKTHL